MNNGGMQLSSDSSEAREALAKAMHGMCLWEADFMDDIKTALVADPDFAMAHAVRALALTFGRHKKYIPMMQNGLDKAKAGRAPLSAHESAYIEALEHAVDLRSDLAFDVYKRILDEHPCDMFIHRMAQMDLFNFGRKSDMFELVETAAPHWSPEMRDYPIFMANRAFANEELLYYAEAERYGR